MTNMIPNRMRAALGAALVAGSLAGCVDFTGPGIDTNPNSPSAASRAQLFSAVQAFQQAGMTGDMNRFATIWMQQMAGVNRQWLSFERYEIDENTQGFDNFYTGGGLTDLRLIQASAKAANDKVFYGIAQVYEAMSMALAADAWGDLPYIQAVNFVAYPTPLLDRQDTVYGRLQSLLDSGINNLTTGTGVGPAAGELVYRGNAAKWIALAHTLKARLYLHVAEVVGAPAYANAATQAALGIASAAGDFNTYQSGTVGEENGWFQFRRNRGTDIEGGKYIIDLMRTRGDPRLANYFAKAPQPPILLVPQPDSIKGAAPGDEDDGSFSWLSSTRADPAFSQPQVTYAENAHILAEAQTTARGGAGDVTALATLNAYRATVAGLAPLAGATACGGAPCTGTALLQEILTSKYIAMFQHIEVWNDYKRTCWPNLAPNATAIAPNTKIPPRFYYGVSERQTNKNLPSVSSQNPGGANYRNRMDPINATTIGGGACLGN